jgi:hypothetical protein
MCSFVPDKDSMRSRDDPTAASTGDDNSRATRRDAIRLVAGGSALALLASGMRSPAAFAQQATPAPARTKEGLYAVLRTRTVKADKSIDELTNAMREGILPIVRVIPGFVEYYVIQNSETRERTGVSIFMDKEGADESTTQVGEYITSQGLADYYEDVEPIVVEGMIVTAIQQSQG